MAPGAVPLFFGWFFSPGAVRTIRARQAFVMRAVIIAATVLHMLNNDFCLSSSLFIPERSSKKLAEKTRTHSAARRATCCFSFAVKSVRKAMMKKSKNGTKRAQRRKDKKKTSEQ